MVKGEHVQPKVHYKGKEDDFIIFVDDMEAVRKWRDDRSIPLTQVVQAFKIFITHKHGTQGQHDTASKSTLENEFGTSDEDECLKLILEKGDLQESESSGRQGSKNDSMGPSNAH